MTAASIANKDQKHPSLAPLLHQRRRNDTACSPLRNCLPSKSTGPSPKTRQCASINGVFPPSRFSGTHREAEKDTGSDRKEGLPTRCVSVHILASPPSPTPCGGSRAHRKQCLHAPRARQRIAPSSTAIPTLLSTAQKHTKHTTAVRPRRMRARTTTVNRKARAARGHANQSHAYPQSHRARTTPPPPMRARRWARGPHAADPRATIGCTRPGSERPPPSSAFSPLPGSVAPTEKPKKTGEATEKRDCHRVASVSTFWRRRRLPRLRRLPCPSLTVSPPPPSPPTAHPVLNCHPYAPQHSQDAHETHYRLTSRTNACTYHNSHPKSPRSARPRQPEPRLPSVPPLTHDAAAADARTLVGARATRRRPACNNWLHAARQRAPAAVLCVFTPARFRGTSRKAQKRHGKRQKRGIVNTLF